MTVTDCELVFLQETRAVDDRGGRDEIFLKRSSGWDDLDGGAGLELRLNGIVKGAFLEIFLVVEIEVRARGHGENFAGLRIHNDHGATHRFELGQAGI